MKLEHSITLSPEAAEALRKVVFGLISDHSPTIRDVQNAIEEAKCTTEDEAALLAVLGFHDFTLQPPPRHTIPPVLRRS